MDVFKITTGNSRYDKDWRVVDVTWTKLVERLSKPTRTRETMEEYLKSTKDTRLQLKDVGGFVGGPMEHDGERKNASIHRRTLVTIDCDGDKRGQHKPDPETIIRTLDGMGYYYAIHSTHSDRPEFHRLRIIMPLDKELEADAYQAVALRIAERIGFDIIDPTTTQKARIMFWPSIPSDAEYIFQSGGSRPIDSQAELNTYVDWQNAAEWPGIDEGTRRAQQRKGVTGDMASGIVQDPTAKDGAVGAFCKTYSIDDAITAFGLPYKPAGKNRYTYTGGSSYGGAIVYNGGRFLYSNHATDPASMQLCNAFDLVRIHNFGSKDYGKGPETPVNRLPSYDAMLDLCQQDQAVKVNLIKSAFSGAPEFDGTSERQVAKPRQMAGQKGQGEEGQSLEDFFSSAAAPDADSADASKIEEDETWMERLDTRGRGKDLIASPNNYQLIFEHDSNLSGHLQMDTFANQALVIKPFPWEDKPAESYPRELTDADRDSIGLYFSQRWKIHTGRDARESIINVQLEAHSVHPVREWLNSLPKWDGERRAERVFIDYLGAPDTDLNRTITRKHLVAAVKRIFQPGCKYDQVLVFVGPEGTGKSSIIEALSNGWFMDSAIPVGEKDAYQNLPGHWLIEMGELADYETKSAAAYKNFISSQVDRYRPAYGHSTISVPRQCVFFGTTNEEGFLKGKTGNRRFWTMDCAGNPQMLPKIFDGTLKNLLPQIWAEVLHYYHAGEELVLSQDMRAKMRAVQEGHEAILRDDNISIIREFILMPKPSDWESRSIDSRRAWYRDRTYTSGAWIPDTNSTMGAPYLHEYICVKEISLVVFGQQLSSRSRYEDDSLYYICDHLECLKRPTGTQRFGREIGTQRAYKVVRGESVNEEKSKTPKV